MEHYRKLVAARSARAEAASSSPEPDGSSSSQPSQHASAHTEPNDNAADDDPVLTLSQTSPKQVAGSSSKREEKTRETLTVQKIITKKVFASHELFGSESEGSRDAAHAKESKQKKSAASNDRSRRKSQKRNPIEEESDSEPEPQTLQKARVPAEVKPAPSRRTSSRLAQQKEPRSKSSRKTTKRTAVLPPSSSSSEDTDEEAPRSRKASLRSNSKSPCAPQTKSSRSKDDKQVSSKKGAQSAGRKIERHQPLKRTVTVSKATKRILESSSSDLSESEPKHSSNCDLDSDMPPLDVPDTRRKKDNTNQATEPPSKRRKFLLSDILPRSKSTVDSGLVDDGSSGGEHTKHKANGNLVEQVPTAQPSSGDTKAKADGELLIFQKTDENLKQGEKVDHQTHEKRDELSKPAAVSTPLHSPGENEALLGDMTLSSDRLVISLSPGSAPHSPPGTSSKHVEQTAQQDSTGERPETEKVGSASSNVYLRGGSAAGKHSRAEDAASEPHSGIRDVSRSGEDRKSAKNQAVSTSQTDGKTGSEKVQTSEEDESHPSRRARNKSSRISDSSKRVSSARESKSRERDKAKSSEIKSKELSCSERREGSAKDATGISSDKNSTRPKRPTGPKDSKPETKSSSNKDDGSRAKEKPKTLGKSLVDEIIATSLKTVGPVKTPPTHSFRIPKKTRQLSERTQDEVKVLSNVSVSPTKIMRGSPEKSRKTASPRKLSSLHATGETPLHLTSTCALSPALMSLVPRQQQQGTRHPAYCTTASDLTAEKRVPDDDESCRQLNSSKSEEDTDALKSIISRWHQVSSSEKKETAGPQGASSGTLALKDPTVKDPPEETSVIQPSPNDSGTLNPLPSVLKSLFANVLPPSDRGSARSAAHREEASAKRAVPNTTLPPALAQLVKPIAASSSNVSASSVDISAAITSLLPPTLDNTPRTTATDLPDARDEPCDKTKTDVSTTKEYHSSDKGVMCDTSSQKDTVEVSVQDNTGHHEGSTEDQGAPDQDKNEAQRCLEQPKLRRDGKRDGTVPWYLAGKKKPVVPPKKKGTQPRVTDEEHLLAYIDLGDRIRAEQKLSQRVDRKRRQQSTQSESKQKVYLRCDNPEENIPNETTPDANEGENVEGNVEVISSSKPEEVSETLTEVCSSEKFSHGNLAKVATVQENVSNDELGCAAKDPGVQLGRDLDVSVKNRSAESTDICPTQTSSSQQTHVVGGAVARVDPRTVLSRVGPRRPSVENDSSKMQREQGPGDNPGEKFRGTESSSHQDMANTPSSRHKEPSGETRLDSSVKSHPVHTTDYRAKPVTTPDRNRLMPDIYQTPYFGCGVVGRKAESIVCNLPKPHIVEDHKILKIPLENSRNAFNVHHHDYDLDPRMKKVLDTESVYLAGRVVRVDPPLPSHSIAGRKVSKTLRLPPKLVEKSPETQAETSSAPENRESEAAGLSATPQEEAPTDQSRPKVSEGSTVPQCQRNEDSDSDQASTVGVGSASTSQENIETELVPKTSESSSSRDSDGTFLKPDENPDGAKVPTTSTESGHIATVSVYAKQSTGKSSSTQGKKHTSGSSTSSSDAAPVEGSSGVQPRSLESVLMNAPDHQSRFKMFVRSSAFASDESNDQEGVAPEPRWIDASLIRRVASVSRPEPRHRVVVGPPVINAITTRHPLFKSPAKTQQYAALSQVQICQPIYSDHWKI